MPSLTDIPIELFLDNIFNWLPLQDLLHLGTTNRFFYQLTSDEALWHRKVQEDYNFHGSETARTTGWKFIYRRLANPKIYVWGDASHARLGATQSGLPRSRTPSGGIHHPIRLNIPGVRMVSLVAGGMSFHGIDALGDAWVWGALDGTGYALDSDGFAESSKRAVGPHKLKMPHPIRSISCARLHSAALDSQLNVWIFTSWGRPMRLNTPLLDKSSSDSIPAQVECGWGFTAVLAQNGDVLVFWPGSGRARQEIHRVNTELDKQGNHTKAIVTPSEPRVIPCHTWDMQAVHPTKLPNIPVDLPNLSGFNTTDKEGTKLVKIAGLDNFLVGLTNRGHVLRFGNLSDEGAYTAGHWEYLPYFSELKKIAKLPAFKDGLVKTPGKFQIAHITAHFKTFTAYSTGEESVILMHNIDEEPTGPPSLTRDIKPKILPSLQYRNIISVVLGDYHFGALTSDGKLLTWGAFSKGALGLGDPLELDAGQPGGFRTAEEKNTVMDARAHMPFVPPNVQEPTEVRFDWGGAKKKKYCFAATAAGWHMGALVIDLEPDDVEEDESESVAMPGAFPTEPQDTPGPRYGHTIPIIGHRVRGGGPQFRIGFAGRGRGGGGPIL